MSQGHKGSILPIRDLAIPVEFSSAHFNFNEDAYGIQYGNLVIPTGTPIYTMRPFEGRFGGGVAIEESTTNIVNNINNGASSYGNGSVTDTIVTGGIFDGWHKVTINTVNTSPSNGLLCSIEGINVPSGGTGPYSFSIDFFCPKGNIVPHINGSTGVGDATNVSGYRWERNNYTRAAGGAAIVLHWYPKNLGGVVAGDVFYWRNKQVDQKAFSTSFTSSSRGSGFLEYANPIEGSSNFTASFWLKVLSGGTSQKPYISISNSTDANSINFDSTTSGDIRFFTYNSATTAAVSSATGFSPSIWNHIVGVKDSTNVKLYVNGSLVSSVGFSGSLNVSGMLQVGTRKSAPSLYSNCIVDELRIDNYVTTEDEIMAWYQSQSPFYNPYDYRGYAY